MLFKKLYAPLITLLLGLNQPLFAACQAGKPNGNMMEDTPTSAFTTSTATATHSLTGLVWDRCSLGQTWNNDTNHCDFAVNTYTWKNALKDVKIRNDTTYLGFNDWRLPNKKELESIIENCGHNPAINQTIFPYMASSDYWSASSDYWSSSSYMSNTTLAWGVDFYSGSIVADYKPSSIRVRLVRGSQLLEPLDFLNPVVSPPSLTSEIYNNNHLFELAEKKFSEFFTPNKAKTLTLDNWEYRYYSGTDTYLGILSENETYILGGTFGSEIVQVGFRNELIDILAK